MIDNIKVIRENLKITWDRQKSCGDNRHKALDFEVGDKVFVQLSPWKGVIRFGRKEKLSRRYIGPYEILACMGPVAYKSRFLLKLSRIDNIFHISMLEKYVQTSQI